MKTSILKLAQIARKPVRRIIGLMSGTSLDGLDIALCSIRGTGSNTKVQVEAFRSISYSEVFKNSIRQVFAQRTVDLQHLTLLHVQIAETHAVMVLDCLQEWSVAPESVDLLASHGQTIYHAPRIFHGLPDGPNATLQIGDGDHLARRTGILTISDFRQKHVAVGGEGAPLALYGDYFLFSKRGENRFLLNIGGIANFTFLPANGDPSRVMAADTGPGNTLIDGFARQLFGVPFDRDGLLAAAGTVDPVYLDKLQSSPYFKRPFPKTTGPETFSMEWANALLAICSKGSNNPYNIMATVTQLSADAIASAIRETRPNSGKRSAVYVSGGGAYNPELMKRIRAVLPVSYKFGPIDQLGIPADAKEAVLFAILANETVAGKAVPGAMLGGVPLVSMGKISLPE